MCVCVCTTYLLDQCAAVIADPFLSPRSGPIFPHRFPCTGLSPIRGFFTSDSLCSLVADPDPAALLPLADSFYSDGSSVFSEAEKSPLLSSLRVCKAVSALFMCWLTGSKKQLGGGFAGP